MMIALNETHDPARRSFVGSANAPDAEFPIQNLPFGVFRPAAGLPPRVGVAIGDQILDVAAAASSFNGLAAEAARVCQVPYIDHLMSLGPQAWSALRLASSRGLSVEQGDESLRPHLTPIARAEMRLPAVVRNFTDFFASVFHATNTGRAFRSARRRSIFSASVCSTIGRRATSRAGSISRSGRSSARISPPRCRHGW
jgi:fumarylacetoacetase